jgi:hypothetical protein
VAVQNRIRALFVAQGLRQPLRSHPLHRSSRCARHNHQRWIGIRRTPLRSWVFF